MSTNAFTTLVMKNPHYVYGAMVMAHSLRLTQTKHKITCMLTSDLYHDYNKLLKCAFDEVYEIDYIEAKGHELTSKKQKEIYSEWMSISPTKWRCLDLCKFKKICFLDADLIITKNIDHLFKLKAPAAAFVNYWLERKNPSYVGIKYGEEINSAIIKKNLRKGYVAIGHCLILEPKCNLVDDFIDFIENKFINNTGSVSMIDEKAIVSFMLHLNKTWTQLNHRYNTMPWYIKDSNTTNINGRKVFQQPKILHFFNKEKPWISERGKWDDTEIWWQYYDDLLTTMPKSEIEKMADVEKFNKHSKKTCPYCNLIMTKVGRNITECMGNTIKKNNYDDRHTMIDSNKITCPQLK